MSDKVQFAPRLVVAALLLLGPTGCITTFVGQEFPTTETQTPANVAAIWTSHRLYLSMTYPDGPERTLVWRAADWGVQDDVSPPQSGTPVFPGEPGPADGPVLNLVGQHAQISFEGRHIQVPLSRLQGSLGGKALFVVCLPVLLAADVVTSPLQLLLLIGYAIRGTVPI